MPSRGCLVVPKQISFLVFRDDTQRSIIHKLTNSDKTTQRRKKTVKANNLRRKQESVIGP